jgi:hypothetical protein
MLHFLLLLVCILSVELFLRLNILLQLNSIINVIKKVTYVIFQKNISDHWKEKVVPAYAFKIMKYSLQILIIILFIFSLFIITSFFFKNFLEFTFSFIGIFEALVFAFSYFYLRALFIK